MLFAQHHDIFQHAASREGIVAYAGYVGGQGDVVQRRGIAEGVFRQFGDRGEVTQLVKVLDGGIAAERLANGLHGSRFLTAQLSVAVGVPVQQAHVAHPVVAEGDVVQLVTYRRDGLLHVLLGALYVVVDVLFGLHVDVALPGPGQKPFQLVG